MPMEVDAEKSVAIDAAKIPCRLSTVRTKRFFTSAAAIVLLAGLLCTGLAVTLWTVEIRREAHNEFNEITARLVDGTQAQIERAIHGLQSTRGFFIASKEVEANEFSAYIDSLDLPGEFPGVTGIGFAQLNAADSADKIEQENCKLQYFQPAIRDQSLGIDFNADPVCQNTIKRAVATGEPTMSGGLHLVHNGKSVTGLLLILKVCKHEGVLVPSNVKLQYAEGVVIAPLMLAEALRSVARSAGGKLDFEIFDGVHSTKESPLFDLDEHLSAKLGAIDASINSERMFASRSEIQIGGRNWTIVTRTTPAFEAGLNYTAPITIGSGGILVSLLISGFIWSLEVSRVRAVSTAMEMTVERKNANVLASAAVREMDDLRRTLNQHAIISVADARGTITSVNEAFCQISGYASEELIGQNHRILNSGKHDEEFWTTVWSSISKGKSWRGEVCNRAKDGTLYWVDSIITPFTNSSGQIDKYVSIRHDVTERKKAEEQARDSEQFLRNAIDSLDSHTVVLDGTGHVRSVNRAWREFALANGGDIKVLEGANYLAVCDAATGSCPEAATVAEAIRAVLAGQAEPPQVEYACHAPRERRWFICSIRGFCRGPERFAVVSHLNITAIKKAEARLQATNAELVIANRLAEAANRAKSEFLANMSHEIRTPLTAVLGFADILRSDGDITLAPEQRLRTIDTITNAGQHLLAIINDILDLSKIEADKMTVERIETPFVMVLREVTALLRPTAAGKGVVLSTTFRSPVPDRIMGDPTRLRQVLMNMVGNAVKFTESGEIAIRVGTESHDGCQRLVINIEDTGPGMTEEHAQRLFQSFGQADTSVTRRFGGAGLGLAISRRLARLMGGSVSLTSTKLGSGSNFQIELPLEPIPGSRLTRSLDEVQQEPKCNAPSSTLPQLCGRMILAEDGPDNQRLFAFHLRKAGAIVDVADNGQIALEMIEAESARGTPYDLLLTDIQMPEMDGHTLARTLRERNCRMSIVALTAHAMDEERRKCILSGCDDFVTKPIDKVALLTVCAKWLHAQPEHSGLPA